LDLSLNTSKFWVWYLLLIQRLPVPAKLRIFQTLFYQMDIHVRPSKLDLMDDHFLGLKNMHRRGKDIKKKVQH
jgi:hypothetical protein